MMKPKSENDHSTGMLEYLEDVIGTVRYKVRFYLIFGCLYIKTYILIIKNVLYYKINNGLSLMT